MDATVRILKHATPENLRPVDMKSITAFSR